MSDKPPLLESSDVEDSSTNEELQYTFAELVAGRVRILAEGLRFNAKTLGEELGIPSSSAANYWTGKRAWPVETLPSLANALNTDLDSLLRGPGRAAGVRSPEQGFKAARRAPSQFPESGDDDAVGIDSIDLSFGLGGTFVDVEPGAIEIEKAQFSRNWLRKFTRSPPEMLFTTSGVGDSMRPTIEDHDVVIVDRSARLSSEMGEKIWAVVYGGVGMIKRLRPMPDGTVRLMSDNQAVRDEIATDNDLYIVGRVVAVVQRK